MILSQIFLIAFYLVVPFVFLVLEKKVKLIQKINPIVILYVIGIIIGNIKLIPESFFGLQDLLSSVSILFAIPLILLSLDILSWKRCAKAALISFGAIIVADILAILIGYLIFKDKISESSKIGGLLVGVYTGGTPNLASLKIALSVNPSTYIAVHTSDIIISSIYLLFIITIAKPIFGKFLPSFKKSEKFEEITEEEEKKYEGILTKGNIVSFFKLIGIDILVFGLSYGISMFFSKNLQTIIIILAVTTFGVLASLIKPFQRIKNSFAIGQYFIMVFCLIVGSMANLQKLIMSSHLIFFYVVIAVFGSLLIHFILSIFLKIDVDTMIITSVSAIFSPPFVPLVATSIKNKEVILSGMITGLIGYAVGNYLGIILSYILSLI
ncbi:MAG: DUF819 family protein [Spirochaetota bacterium]